MSDLQPKSCTAFLGHSRIAAGSVEEVALAAKAAIDCDGSAPLLIFDDVTAQQVELDLRGTPHDVIARLAARFPRAEAEAADVRSQQRRAGRPKLGVIGREVTLLPRHWDWLAEQPGGASVTIRRLIDAERKSSTFKELARKAQEAAYRFMLAMAGNFPHFDEVARALFAGDRATFFRLTEGWPVDVRDHARRLMADAAEVA